MDSATPGTVIADRYRLVRPLGAGSSATVWEAADTALDRTVAVKLLHGPALADPTERERLRREARALARLAHPRITVVFDYLEQAQPNGTPQPVLITELLHGTTLADRLRGGPLPAAEAVAVCAQLADALRAAHDAGIVHRDVKPGNVMLTASGAKLLDFGIAQAATDSNLTGSMVIGTPACMAPEQLAGRAAVPATDVYALGCVLYWCLTGHAPYENPDVMQVAQEHIYAPPPPLNVSDLSPIVVDVYTRCMAKDAAQRPSAAEVYALLSQAADQPPIAQRTLVLPAFDAETQQTPLPGDHRPLAAAAPVGQQSRTRLLIGALVVAAVAAGITALVLELSNSGSSSGTPPVASSSGAVGITASSTPSPTPSPSADSPTPSTSAAPGDPADDPIGYLESVRAQIDGFIAQGQDTIDPNTGRDLQNSLADLENAITAAQNNGGDSESQWNGVTQKIDGVAQKISGDIDSGNISQDAADQLTAELQSLSNALPNKGD